ncbi:MAG: winged helix-turn-helix transcriptional regulator, partial [Mycobacterium sp.]
MTNAPTQERSGHAKGASSSCVGRRDVPGPSTDCSVTDGLRWIGNHNSVAVTISQNSRRSATRTAPPGSPPRTVPPCVHYSISEYGLTLAPALAALCDWGRGHLQRRADRVDSAPTTGASR